MHVNFKRRYRQPASQVAVAAAWGACACVYLFLPHTNCRNFFRWSWLMSLSTSQNISTCLSRALKLPRYSVLLRSKEMSMSGLPVTRTSN